MIDTPVGSVKKTQTHCLIFLWIFVLFVLPALAQARKRSFTLQGIKVQQPARQGQTAFVAYARKGTVATSGTLSLTAYDVTLTTVNDHQQASMVVTAATLQGTAQNAHLGGPLSFAWARGRGQAREGKWQGNRLLLWQVQLQSPQWQIRAPFGYLLDLDQPLPYAHLVSGVNAWFAPSLLP